MNSIALNPVDVLVGILIGIGGVIALISRLDRAGESGCFYGLLLTMIFAVVAVLMLGTAAG
jgi:hypothetical protein